MDSSNININYIDTIVALAEKQRVTSEEIIKNVSAWKEMQLHLLAKPQNSIEQHNSPESPISGDAETTEEPINIPLNMQPPSPELLPKPKPISIFDLTSSPLSLNNNNNINSAVEAPFSDDNDETLEITDEVGRDFDKVINEHNENDSGSGGSNVNTPVPLEESTSPFMMQLIFSAKGASGQLYSAEQTINNFKWILKISFKKAFEKGNKKVPFLLGLFLHCKGPAEENSNESILCNVRELNFKIHNHLQGIPGLMKTKVCKVPFESDLSQGVYFELDGKQKMIEEGLIIGDGLKIRVSVVLIFRNNSSGSFPDDE